MKAILVIDMPKDCYGCPCYKKGRTRYECSAYLFNNNRILNIDDLSSKPNDCPLKPLPQKIEVDVKKVEDIMHTEFQMANVFQDKIIADIKLETDKLIALGWNKCIDKILGEECDR